MNNNYGVTAGNIDNNIQIQTVQGNVNFGFKPENSAEPLVVDWHQICQSRLDAYEERFFKNNPLTGINFYVPLGLVEPKREQEKRQKQEVNPEDGSQFYQLAETEITKTYNEPNQFFEEVLRQGNSKTKGQRLAIIGEPGAGKTTLLYQIARWILQENLGYPILIRLADVDKPIRDYLTQNWLRDATPSLTGVSPEWVAGFERLITKKPNYSADYSADYSAVETASTQTKPAVVGCEPLDFSSVREGGHRLCSREFHSPDTSSPSSADYSADYSAVETASTHTKPACAGCEPLDSSSVREGGHRLCSREFHSPDTSSPSSPDYSPDYSAVETASTQTKPACAGSQIVPFSQQVYLLLDAVDEMGITSPLASINQQLAEGWTQGLRVVLTCRLNVWEGEKNALRDFDVYRNLDFNSQQIQDFIEQWFNDKTQSQELLKQLKEPNQTRINDLIKNPLRLALLCRTWKRGQKLPETQAGLYQRLVNSHYQWKDEQKPFQIPLEVQECLHQQLGELAKNAINREQFRFRLEEKFVEQYLGKPQRENSLFDWALKLGWLNRVGLASVEEKDSDQAVYAFFHPTFQEYFAALAINDWDYFLPRNHVNCPVEGKEYRIFQPQWKQVILLWLGRDNREIEKGEKEAFIQKLVSFDDGCGEWSYRRLDRGFYEYRAYFLAGAAINEFKECSLSDAIVEQIIKWGFGYYNIKELELEWWKTFIFPIKIGAIIVLPETIREKAIANLIQVLETTKNEYTCHEVAYSLEKLAVGNELAIEALIRVLETTESEYDRRRVAESLGKIDPGNELAIQALIQVLETTDNEWNRMNVVESLGEIDPGNELAIQALIRVLETTDNEWNRMNVANSLGKIVPKNELAIGALIRVLKNTENEWNRMAVANSLGKIVPGNKLVIGELIRVLETTNNEYTRRAVANSLGKIAPGDELEIWELIRVLETTDNEWNRRSVVNILEKLYPKNKLVIRPLIRVLKTTHDEFTRRKVAYILEKIVLRNKLAIGALIQVLETTHDEFTRRIIAESLGKIDPGNELAIRELIRVLETTEDEGTRWSVANSLGKIAPGNKLATQALIQVLETIESEDTRRRVAESLGEIDPGNELAIQALIQVLKTTEDENTRWKVAESLGKIAVGNELAIRELIRVLETTESEGTRWSVAESLGEIDPGNELAIQVLIRGLKTTNDKWTCRRVAESLEKIIKTEKQYADVVFALNHNLTNEVYNNNFDLFEECYKLLWPYAQNLPYPKFYQAWHHNTLTPHPEIIDNTPVDNTPTVRQLEQQFTDICTQLPHLPLHCININKLLTLNTKNEFIQAFCNRLYQKLLPDGTPPEVQTPANLETKIIHLKQQLQTPHLFILLLADGTPTPEVIDCCDYLTDVLHLGWITPNPLPLPPPQRSFVTSQENLLKAVESWVKEY